MGQSGECGNSAIGGWAAALLDHAMGTLSELQGILVVGCGVKASPKPNTQELAIAFARRAWVKKEGHGMPCPYKTLNSRRVSFAEIRLRVPAED